LDVYPFTEAMREAANIRADRPGGEAAWCAWLVNFVEDVELTEWRVTVFVEVVLDIEDSIFVEDLSVGGEPATDVLFDGFGCTPCLVL
jgi:hypothetical protein